MGDPGNEEPARPGGRLVRIATGVALLLGVAAWLQPAANGGDLWWHLAAGRLMAHSGAIPFADAFSHTAAGAAWIDHEWLWDLAAWHAYAASPDLLAWLNLGLLVLTFAASGLAALRLSRSPFATLAAVWLAAATAHWFVDVRPQTATFFCVALLLATRDHRRAPWLWPPLLLVWANLHGGFVFGLGVVGLDATHRTLSAHLGGAPIPWARWAGVAAAAGAAAVNPWGPSIYLLPLETLDPTTPFRDLIEWYPGQLGLDPRRWDGRFLLMLLAAAGGLPFVRRVGLSRTGFWVALAVVTAAMAFSARRFVPLFALCSAPLAALGLAAGLTALHAQIPSAWLPRTRAAAAVGALALPLVWWSDVRFLPRPLQRWTAEESYPAAAVAALRSLAPPPAHLFHGYGWGGYLMLRAPEIPVFIDGRAGTVYADDVAMDYLRLLDVAPGWRDTLRRRRIDAVLLAPGAPLITALRAEPDWQVVYAEPRAWLLLRDAAAPPQGTVALPASERDLVAGFHALRRKRLGEAEARLEAAVREDPLQLDAYRGLMQVSARRGDASGVARWRDAALAAYPRRREGIWASSEAAYRTLGDRAAQLAAFRALRPRGPFARPDDLARVDEAIRELEAETATD